MYSTFALTMSSCQRETTFMKVGKKNACLLLLKKHPLENVHLEMFLMNTLLINITNGLGPVQKKKPRKKTTKLGRVISENCQCVFPQW